MAESGRIGQPNATVATAAAVKAKKASPSPRRQEGKTLAKSRQFSQLKKTVSATTSQTKV